MVKLSKKILIGSVIFGTLATTGATEGKKHSDKNSITEFSRKAPIDEREDITDQKIKKAKERAKHNLVLADSLLGLTVEKTSYAALSVHAYAHKDTMPINDRLILILNFTTFPSEFFEEIETFEKKDVGLRAVAIPCRLFFVGTIRPMLEYYYNNSNPNLTTLVMVDYFRLLTENMEKALEDIDSVIEYAEKDTGQMIEVIFYLSLGKRELASFEELFSNDKKFPYDINKYRINIDEQSDIDDLKKLRTKIKKLYEEVKKEYEKYCSLAEEERLRIMSPEEREWQETMKLLEELEEKQKKDLERFKNKNEKD